MNNRFVVSFAAAAFAAVPAQATVTFGGALIGTLQSDRPAEIKRFDLTGQPLGGLNAFPGFAGGVYVAAGDVNGDGLDDIIAGHANGPLVNVFNGRTLEKHASFEPFGASFNGGIFVAAGDLDGDGKGEIIAAAGPGGGPHVRVFDNQLNATHDFNAFDPGFQGGVRVAAGDVTGDGVAELLVGTGPGGGTINAYDGKSGRAIGSFDPFGGDYHGGLFFTTGKFQGGDALFVSKELEGDGSVFVFRNGAQSVSFRPFGEAYLGGVTLGFITDGTSNTLIVGEAVGGRAGFINVDARGATIAGDANPPTSDIFFDPFGSDYLGGISVAGLLVTPVPEPATWGMMVAGFAAAGLSLRRRLRRAQRAANAA